MHDSQVGPQPEDRLDVLLLLLGILAVVALIGVLLAVFVDRFVGRVTIHEYERGLHFSRGRFVGLLDVGTRTYFRPTTEVRVLDGRPTSMTIEGQEVMTSDGVAIKISLVVRYVIGDPAAWVMADHDAGRTLYLDIQLGLREIVAGRTLDEILAARTTIGPEVTALVAPQVATIGIELVAVEVRDVMVPSEVKRAFAGVVAARHEGAAALERARGETAALRSLANAGRMVADNPGLLSLRVVQELGARGGNTIMLGLPDGTAASATAGRAGDAANAGSAMRRSRRRATDAPADGE